MKEQKTKVELEALIASELIAHDAPPGVVFEVHPDGDSWRPILAAVTTTILGQEEWIARAVQICDRLKTKYDLKD